MNRKEFIESLGATCKNWQWSWSFINENKRQIIFGAWDDPEDGGCSLIFSLTWEHDRNGRKNNGYPQSLEHIQLMEKDGYQLFTFKMYRSNEAKDKTDIGPATIRSFENEIKPKKLVKRNGDYYAINIDDDLILPEELDANIEYKEGTKEIVTVNSYERNPEAREKCIDKYGCYCAICGFDFEKTYGLLGAKYIQVHHKTPLHEIQKEYIVSPEKDLIPVCANCHAMIHRGRKTRTVDDIKERILETNKQK